MALLGLVTAYWSPLPGLIAVVEVGEASWYAAWECDGVGGAVVSKSDMVEHDDRGYTGQGRGE